MQTSYGLKNAYFNCVDTFCNVHDLSYNQTPTKQLDGLLSEWGALKNLLSGVNEVNLSCAYPENVHSVLKKYNMQGLPVVEAKYATQNGFKNAILHIKNVLELSENELSEISMYSGQNKLPVLITYGRTLYEMGTIDKTYNLSPARFLEELGFLDRNCLILGGNYLDKDDLEILSNYDTKLALTPQSDSFKGRGAINLSPLLSKGIDFTFASDDFPFVNMLAELNLASSQTANAMLDAEVANREELFESITSTKSLKLDFNERNIEKSVLSNALPRVELDEKYVARLAELEEQILKEIK